MKKLSVVACSAFAALMFVACSDDPVTAAVPPAGGGAGQGGGVALDSTRNSSDVAQSSSSNAAESSSSVVSSSSEEDPSRVIVTDANVQCEDRRTFDDPMLDGSASAESFTREKSDAALPPVAYRYVSTENVGFTIKNVTATCKVSIDSLEITTADNTIYVNAKYDFTNAQRCLCRSQITFSMKLDPAYNTAKYLVLNDGGSTNFNNKMEIVDLDVIRTDDIPNNDF